jgi:hypothetical protein
MVYDIDISFFNNYKVVGEGGEGEMRHQRGERDEGRGEGALGVKVNDLAILVDRCRF